MAHGPGPSFSDSLLDTVPVETPEHVAFSYEIAGLGSRFVALFTDSVLYLLGLSGLFLLLARLPEPESTGVEEISDEMAAFVGILIFFLLYWGYFLAFEAVWHGQTPGKRVMGIRAVADGGFPLTPSAAAVRNLLRLVDMQPVGFYFVGAVTMLLNREAKRLGDLAAGTIVIRDRRGAEGAPLAAALEAIEPEEAAGPPRLGKPELALLERFVARRGHLAKPAGERLAAELARMLGDRYAPREAESAADRVERAWRTERARRRRRAAAAPGADAGPALAERFVRAKEPRWRALADRLLRTRRRGLAALGPEELSEFAGLYREAAADLARARTYGVDRAVVLPLERLVAAGHSLLYRRRGRFGADALRFLRREFPRLVRRQWIAVGVAACVLFVPALIGYVRVRGEPEAAHDLLHPQLIARAEEAPARIAEGRGYAEIPSPFMPVFAGGIIANNVQVTFLAFALGITAGAGTLLLLLFNGLHIGATLGLFDGLGVGMYLWSFVLPHGIVELTAAAIAGGAGLLLGSAWVLPGERTRREALIERGRAALRLLIGTCALLILAGLVEGFVSPSDLAPQVKLGFGLTLGALLFAYLARAGRDGHDSRHPAASRTGDVA
jgi:uncharacterized membrane protein SpoIIM required for sporulation/uncharacterized RDD family membrane protein YckC